LDENTNTGEIIFILSKECEYNHIDYGAKFEWNKYQPSADGFFIILF
jgi:hypothetical protein